MKSIYIGNLSYKVTQEQIHDLFAQFGDVISIKVISDKQTGKLKGYAFVEMEDENAKNAIANLNQTSFLGRTIKVNEAKAQ